MEIANVPVAGKVGDNEVKLYFTDLSTKDMEATATELGLSESAKHLSTKWGKGGANYVDGYVGIFGYNEGDDSNKVDQQIIAKKLNGDGKNELNCKKILHGQLAA